MLRLILARIFTLVAAEDQTGNVTKSRTRFLCLDLYCEKLEPVMANKLDERIPEWISCLGITKK